MLIIKLLNPGLLGLPSKLKNYFFELDFEINFRATGQEISFDTPESGNKSCFWDKPLV